MPKDKSPMKQRDKHEAYRALLFRELKLCFDWIGYMKLFEDTNCPAIQESIKEYAIKARNIQKELNA